MSFVETFAAQGCLVVDRLFDPALIEQVHGEYRRQYAAFDPADLPLHMKVGEGRLHLPMRMTGPLLDPAFYAHPLLMRMIASLLGDTFLIDNVNCVVALAGAGEQRIHMDHNSLFPEQRDVGDRAPPYAVTVAIPLIDLDEATGTTRLFPGSLAAASDADGNPPAFGGDIKPFVKRGGCFLMDYRLWHHGLANRSDVDRPILYIVYSREWFTDVRNFKKHSRLLVDASELERIPIEHRSLFRRLSAQGLLDLSIKQVLGQA